MSRWSYHVSCLFHRIMPGGKKKKKKQKIPLVLVREARASDPPDTSLSLSLSLPSRVEYIHSSNSRELYDVADSFLSLTR